MKFLVECPVCENRTKIAAEQNQDKFILCNLCNNSFELAANRVKEDKKRSPTEPEQVQNRAKEIPAAQPVLAATPVATADPLESFDAPASAPNVANPFEVAASTKARAMLKRRRKPIVPILLGLAALASAGALIAVIVITDPFRKPQIEQDELALNEDLEDPNQDPDSGTDPDAKDADSQDASVFRTDGQSDEVELPPTNAPPDKPPKSGPHKYITKTQIQDFWDQQFWYFVRLRVETDEGSHYVSGTIVDSRGWVATSLSAVANAKEIEVQLAASKLKKLNGIQLTQTDLVRGVINTDPGSDLVLLSINRDFVPNAPGVSIGSSSNLVASENVIQCACPGTENLAWPQEAQLDGRKTFEDFDFDFKSQLGEKQMDESTEFIMHSGYTDTAHGAALFSVEGKLVGINTSVTDDSSKVLATTAEKLTELISSSEDNPLGLSTLNR